MERDKICRAEENGLILAVRLTPKAAQDSVSGISQHSDGKFYLNIHLRAVPEDGKANKALLKFLSKQLKMPQSHISLVKGQTTRFKQLALRGDKTELQQKLDLLLLPAVKNR